MPLDVFGGRPGVFLRAKFVNLAPARKMKGRKKEVSKERDVKQRLPARSTMEPSTNTTASAIIDEWGKYIVKDGDILRINKAGVLESIQKNNPAITAVKVKVDDDNDSDDDDLIEVDRIEVDWDAAGKSTYREQSTY